MQGEERAALRTERELRHKTNNPVDYPPEILDQWRDEQQSLKSLLVVQDATPWAYPLQPPPAAAPPVAKASPQFDIPAEQQTAPKPSWSQVVGGAVNEKQPLRLVGGVDLSFFRDDKRTAIAALVVCSFPQLEVVYEVYKVVELTAPYIPGYLAFREVPALVGLIDHVRANKPQFLPQVLLVDGNGILHYGGFGSACQLGVVSGIPTIGVAKKLLCVDGLLSEVDIDRWTNKCQQFSRDWVEIDGRSGRVHGAMVLPKARTSEPPTPLFVSIGHRVSLQTAVAVTLACIKNTMPEPIDQADLRSRDHVRKLDQERKRKGETTPRYGLLLEKAHNTSAAGSRTPTRQTARRTKGNNTKERNGRIRQN